MRLKTEFAKKGILQSKGLNHLYIEVIPEVNKEKNNKPTLFMFVIDRSGSMGSSIGGYTYSNHTNYRSLGNLGSLSNPINMNSNLEVRSKIDYAISSVTKFLNLVNENDKIGVIAFDNSTDVIQEITSVGKNKNEIVNNIRNIMPRGCTNVSDAILLAKSMIKSETIDYTKDYNCKIILLSDGKANEGLTDKDSLSSISLECFKSNMTVTSLGIGDDYDSHILGTIAEKGNGLIYHISDMNRLEQIFNEELALSHSISGKSAKVKIKLPDLIEVKENLNGYVQNTTTDGIEILLGDIFNKRKIAIEISNNMVQEDMTFITELEYISNDDNIVLIKDETVLKVYGSEDEFKNVEENTEIIEYVLSLVKSNAILNATEGFETNNSRGMSNSFQDGMLMSKSISANYFCNNLASETLSELEELNQTFSSGKISSSESKKLYENNYKSRR